MVALNMPGLQSQTEKKKSLHQQQRQLAISKLNQRRRVKERIVQNSLADHSGNWEHAGVDEVARSGVARYDYEANELDEISIQVGDVVEAVVDTGDGSAKGTSACTGKTGSFPLSFIEFLKL